MKTYTFKITFIGDYFTLTTRIETNTSREEVAYRQACDLIESQYGWDVDAVTNDVEVEAV